jgi:hypothetical protein
MVKDNESLSFVPVWTAFTRGRGGIARISPRDCKEIGFALLYKNLFKYVYKSALMLICLL